MVKMRIGIGEGILRVYVQKALEGRYEALGPLGLADKVRPLSPTMLFHWPKASLPHFSRTKRQG